MKRKKVSGNSTLIIGLGGVAVGVALGWYLCNRFAGSTSATSTTSGLGRHRWRGQGGGQIQSQGTPQLMNPDLAVSYDSTPDDDEGY